MNDYIVLNDSLGCWALDVIYCDDKAFFPFWDIAEAEFILEAFEA